MRRRFWVPAAVLAAFLSITSIQQPVLAQEAPPQDTPAQETPAQEAPAAPAPAQETPVPTDPAPTESAPVDPAPVEPAAVAPAAVDPQQARAAYEAKFADWKEAIKTLRTLKHDYQLVDEAGRANMEQQWTATLAQAERLLKETADAGLNAFRAAPNEDRELATFLVKLLQEYVATDQYEAAAALGNALIDSQCDMPQIYREAGLANFSINNMDRTMEIFEKAQANNALSGASRELRQAVEEYKGLWQREQELRQKEAAADDLPRVKLSTSKGDIVIELFENEAPETVGNFISLVNTGFYDGLTFHRVIAAFMAQTGCPEGDGTGGPGYSIYDEYDKPEARVHFGGSVSMAKTMAPNSGGSQFFICFRPQPELNGKHTVFGRVIEGIEVLAKLQRRDPTQQDQPEPDSILKAEVLRSRPNVEYVPRKVE